MSTITTVWNGWHYWEVETLSNGQMGSIRYVMPEPLPEEDPNPKKQKQKKSDPNFVPGKFRNLSKAG